MADYPVNSLTPQSVPEFANMLQVMPFSQTLPPAQETAYRAWLSKIGYTKERGFKIDNTYTGTNYDLRGFFKKYGPVDINVRGGQHFTDEFKLPNHDTFSVESRFARGTNAQKAGRWEGDTYIPPGK